MHSVGRSSEPGDPVRGSVAQADPMVAAPQVGNRALAQMAAGAQVTAGVQPPVAPIAIPRPPSASLSLDDPSFNPTTRAHDLLRAIDSEQYTFAMKGSGTPFGGMTEDVAAERRKI